MDCMDPTVHTVHPFDVGFEPAVRSLSNPGSPPLGKGSEPDGSAHPHHGHADMPRRGACEFRRVLGPGAAGEDVACLQRHLADRNAYQGPASAWYGPRTAAGVQEFQRQVGLAVDGVFGPDCASAYQRWIHQREGSDIQRASEVGRELVGRSTVHSDSDGSDPGSDEEETRSFRTRRSGHELRGLRVALDVGHGAHPLGFEVGSRGVRGTEEFQLNSVLSEEIAQGLRRRGAHVNVYRYGEDHVERLWLPERGKKAKGHHLFVSCHHNAHDGKTQGTETLVDVDGTDEDVQLAHHVQSGVVRKLWSECVDAWCVAQKDRGVKWQNLGVLGTVPMDVEAACLVEPYFMDDQTVDGYERIGTHMTKLAARGVVDGIRKYWMEKKNPRYKVLVQYQNEKHMERLQEVAPGAWCVRMLGHEQEGCEHDEIHAGTFSNAKTAQAHMELLSEQGYQASIRSTAEER